VTGESHNLVSLPYADDKEGKRPQTNAVDKEAERDVDDFLGILKEDIAPQYEIADAGDEYAQKLGIHSILAYADTPPI